MRPADDIKQLFRNAELRIYPDGDERVFGDVLQARQKRTEEKVPALPESTWRVIMRSPFTKLAAAAVLIACVVGLSLWRTTSSGIALADVLARMERVKASKFKWRVTMTGGDPNKPFNFEQRGSSLDSPELDKRLEIETLDPNGQPGPPTEQYDLPRKKLRIVIYPTQKTYVRQEFNDVDAQGLEEGSMGDPLSFLKDMLRTKYESLGRSTMDGVEVAGFRTTDPNFLAPRNVKNPRADSRIWVDVKTLLPVRLDQLTSYELDGAGSQTMHLMVYGFEWDIPTDASQFEPPPIPAGYAIQDLSPDGGTEETAIQGLRQCVELLGNYPERISLAYLWWEVEKSETPVALRLKEELKGLSGFARDNKKMGTLKPARFLIRFYFQVAGKDRAYYGKTVTPKDADKVLLRWKLSDTEYRVIFGDLHAETASPEKLAELERGDLPK